MAFRVTDCFDTIRHALGGKPSSELSMISLVNEAGEHLVNMHGWRWLLRATAALDTVAGQSWIALPADFGQLIAIEITNGLAGTLEIGTLSEILSWRTGSLPGGSTARRWSIGYYIAPNGVPTPRLEFYPAPDTDNVGAYTLWYVATWVDVAKEIDAVPVPSFMRPLFLATLRAFAAGYEHDDQGTVDARLAQLMGGPLFMAAQERDKVIQPGYGSLIDNEMSWSWWQDQPLLDP